MNYETFQLTNSFSGVITNLMKTTAIVGWVLAAVLGVMLLQSRSATSDAESLARVNQWVSSRAADAAKQQCQSELTEARRPVVYVVAPDGSVGTVPVAEAAQALRAGARAASLKQVELAYR